MMRARWARFATPAAAAIALLWALSPLHTNIVDYVSQRTEGLMGTFYLLTLYAFARSTENRSRAWSVVAMVSALLGALTKEGIVTVPAIVLLYDRTFISGSFAEALKRHWGTLVGICSCWVAIALVIYLSDPAARGVGGDISRLKYVATETQVVLRYLKLTLVPAPLVFDYGPVYLTDPNIIAACTAGVALLVGATLYAIFRAPVLGFAGAWFFIMISPGSSGVLPLIQQPCAENRIYLATIGIVGAVVCLGYRALQRRATPLFVIGGAALGVATYAHNPVLASELAVWNDTAAKRPENWRAFNNLGNSLLKADRVEDALPYFDRAIAVNPTYADAHNNRGVVMLRRRDSRQALEEFTLATQYKPNYADAFYNMGEAHLQLGKPEDAIPPLRRSLEINPNNPKAYNNLGIALLDSGHVQESIEAERNAIRLNPNLPEAHYNLGNSLARAGDKNAAVAEYDEALRIQPTFARAHNNAGVIFLQQGKMAEARARFEAAVRINPSYPEALQNLELVRARPPAATVSPVAPH
jgi:tetratricopeptide (TPR) repeat protein